jgi:hypothetical protein
MSRLLNNSGARGQRERPGSGTVPAVVTCACGQANYAARRPRHQFVSCTRCRAELFVLPRSPWPSVTDGSTDPRDEADAPATALAPARRVWLLPLLAGALTLLLVVVLFAALWPSSHPRPGERDRSVEALPLEEQISEGKRAFEEGSFRVSARLLEAALAQLDQAPQKRPAAERRQLAHLYREAVLLSDLLEQPLADTLARGEGLPEREWREAFRGRYQGRAVVFDGHVRRDAAGQVGLRDWEESVNGVEVRLELSGLRLLQRLPLADERRLLFGARLADARRENRGWVVTFEPDSGVLLTDPGVFAGTSLPREPELQSVLTRQANWVDAEGP